VTRKAGNLHEDQCAFLTTSLSFILSMRHASDKIFTENQNAYIVVSNIFSFRKSYLL